MNKTWVWRVVLPEEGWFCAVTKGGCILDPQSRSGYFAPMPAPSVPLRQRALKLSARKRLGLATLLLESVSVDAGVDPALLKELKKRSSELSSGKVRGLSTEEAYGFSL
jgi:hypothetical protein